MSKIGRNTACPCGSGKKYKKCCKNKVSENLAKMSFPDFVKEASKSVIEKEHVDATGFFGNYTTSGLLRLLALLQLEPKNHGKNIRLLEITKQAITSKSNESPVDISAVKKYIHEKFPYNHREDPPENLFTENLIASIGNITVFPGNSEGDVGILQQLINALNDNNEKLSVEFRKEATNSILLLLSISNFIGKGFGIKRNHLSEFDESNDIYFPEDEEIKNKIGYLSFTESDLEVLAKPLNVSISVIEEYLINVSDDGLKAIDTMINPILFKPIIKINDEYIVVSPTSIVSACIYNIWMKAKSYGCFGDLISHFSDIGWSQSRYCLKDIGYAEIEFNFPSNTLPIHEGIFLFDTDKIAYVIYKYDDGNEYGLDYPYNPNQDETIFDKIQDRRKEIALLIDKDPRFDKHQVLQINIYCGIGRPYYVSNEIEEIGWLSLNMSSDNLIVLFKSGKCHNLTLWNYSLAVNENPVSTPYFIDNITYFIENDESFYSGDDLIGHIAIQVGNALNFKHTAIINHDDYLAVYPKIKGWHLIPVSREKLPALLPIYSTRRIPIVPYMVTTKVGEKELWVKPIEEFVKPKNQKQKFEIEICVAIAYWFSVMSKDIADNTNFSKIRPVVIEVETVELINTQDIFENLDKEKELDSEIKIEFEDNRMKISLNEYFYYFLFRNDNLGERVMMQKILSVLNLMLLNKELLSTLDVNCINALIDNYMPLGKKKKLLVQVSSFDVRLNPQNTKSTRELYPFEVNRQIDNLGLELSSKPYTPVDNLNSNKKKKLINSVVLKFYTELRLLLSNYEQNDILSKLLIFYESSIHKREHFNFEMTPKIECFKDYIDIQSVLSKENQSNTSYSVSLRCLIEHVIAEPSEGKQKFNVEGIDRAIAYMHNIITWGFLSDELNFKIVDTGVSLLPSGRIGTDKEFQKNVIKPFYNQKFSEDVTNNVWRFDSSFIIKDDSDVDPSNELDPYIEAEYNINHDDFSKIIFKCIYRAFDEDGGIYKNKKESFINELSTELNITTDVIESLISTFSLSNRGKVENVSELGFNNQDFYPWRFNRGLSLLKKPFIVFEKDSVEYIWFGARILMDFKFHIYVSINSGRFNASSEAMKTYLGQVNRQNGTDFNNKVFQYLDKEFKDAKVYKELKINSTSSLYNEEDLGDFDILIVNDSKKHITAIESKHINVARTPYEMHLELLKFVSGGEPWIPKVDKRNEWLQRNLALLSKVHGTDVSRYSFEYLFLTNEVIPLAFIKKNEIDYRFTTFYEVQNNIEILEVNS